MYNVVIMLKILLFIVVVSIPWIKDSGGKNTLKYHIENTVKFLSATIIDNITRKTPAGPLKRKKLTKWPEKKEIKIKSQGYLVI